MTQNVPALRGKFGSTEFFLATFKASELSNKLVIPKEMKGWDDLNPEERFQRDINYKRVKSEIAPYLAHDQDRFIGSFIVTVKNSERMVFQSFAESGLKIPAMMGAAVGENSGILTFAGEEVLIPLDGQHRLAALKFAISGKDEKGADIPNLVGNEDLARDTCTVILIRDNIEKSRKIFNKVNRYAKSTSKADNLIVGDDDIAAVLTRDIVVSDLIGARIVNNANTLSKNTRHFATLATSYEISKSVLEFSNSLTKLDVNALPDAATVALYKTQLKEFWEEFLKISAFATSIMDPEESGDQTRIDVRATQINCKPIVMRALADAFIDLQTADENGSSLSIKQCVERANKVDWGYENPVWENVLKNQANRIISGNPARKFAANMIAYLLGKKSEPYLLEHLQKVYETETGGSEFPNQMFE